MTTTWADDIYRSDHGGSIFDEPVPASPKAAVSDDARAIRFDCLRLALSISQSKNPEMVVKLARAFYEFISEDSAWPRPQSAADKVLDEIDPPAEPADEYGDDAAFDNLSLPIRATNCLRDGGYVTIGEVRRATDRELLSIHNLGLRTLADIRDAIAMLDRERKRSGLTEPMT